MGEERAGCFTLSSWSLVIVCVALPHYDQVPLVGLQCVIVVFPDHTHLLFLCHLGSFAFGYCSAQI